MGKKTDINDSELKSYSENSSLNVKKFWEYLNHFILLILKILHLLQI